MIKLLWTPTGKFQKKWILRRVKKIKGFLVVTNGSCSMVVSSEVLPIRNIQRLHSPMLGMGVKIGVLFFTYYFT